jgi:hypothetical protein
MKVKLQESYYRKMFEIIENAKWKGALYTTSAQRQACNHVSLEVEGTTLIAWSQTITLFIYEVPYP